MTHVTCCEKLEIIEAHSIGSRTEDDRRALDFLRTNIAGMLAGGQDSLDLQCRINDGTVTKAAIARDVGVHRWTVHRRQQAELGPLRERCAVGIAVQRLREDCGFTLDATTGEEPCTGYACCLPESTRSFVKLPRYRDVALFIVDHEDALMSESQLVGRCFLGGWYDETADCYTLDVTRVESDLAVAMTVASQCGQQAVFDLRSKRLVFVNDD